MQKVLFTVIMFLHAVFAFSENSDTIRILAIGNSFSEDAVENYLYDIAKADSIVLIIGDAMIGGCSLEKHWFFAKNDSAAYSYRKINSEGVKSRTDKAKLSQAIADEKWDYITFQQSSACSGQYETYFPFLVHLKEYTDKHAANPNVRYALYMTWAYAQNTTNEGFLNYSSDQLAMYNAIVNTARKAAHQLGFGTVIPAGTAIQNGRTSPLGDTFCRDGFHLNTLVGRYTVACTWYAQLTGKSVVGNSFIPPALSEADALIARQAACNAVLQPYSITGF
jgi:hypothetical protein